MNPNQSRPTTQQSRRENFFRDRINSAEDTMVENGNAKKDPRRMRFFIAVGLLLPTLATILGVVAWTVSTEAVIGNQRATPIKAHIKVEDKPQRRISNSSQTIFFLPRDQSLFDRKLETIKAVETPKPSTGAQVAEVIDKLVSMRKKESSGSHHILVVAPSTNGSPRSFQSVANLVTSAPPLPQPRPPPISRRVENVEKEIELVIDPSTLLQPLGAKLFQPLRRHFIDDHMAMASYHQPIIARRPPPPSMLMMTRRPELDYHDYSQFEEPRVNRNRLNGKHRHREYEYERKPTKYIDEEEEEAEPNEDESETDEEDEPVRKPAPGKPMIFNLNRGGNVDNVSADLFKNILFPLMPKKFGGKNDALNGKLVFGFLLDKKNKPRKY